MSQTATASPTAGNGVGTPYLIAFVCGLAAFMEVLDTSIANVALVHISGSLSASADEATWVLTSYLVSNAIILPMTGWLSDTIGRKRYYLLSMLLFTISSVLCGLSTSLPELIVFRVVQGLAGGALQPVSQAILADSFPPEKRGMALAVYGMAVIAGPAIGPTLGGWLTDNYSWHWIFLINAPVGFVLLAVAGSLLRDSATQQAIQEKRRSQGFTVDYWGFALIAISMGALQIMLDKGQQDDWLSSNFICSLLVITVVSLAALVWRELRHPHPIINLRLLANRNFAIANVLIFNVGVVLLGATLLLPQFMQTLLNYSALDAGIVLSPAAIATIIMMPIAGRLSDRIDARILCSFGFFSIAVAMFAMTHVSLDISQHGLMMLRMIQVVGLAFIFVPINAVAYAGLPPADTGSATAIINLTRNVGGGVGISLVTTHLARSTQTHQAHLVDHVSQLDPAYQSTMQSLMPTLGSEQSAQALIAREVTQQATLLGFIDDFYLLTILALFMASLVWFARRIKPGTKPPEGAH